VGVEGVGFDYLISKSAMDGVYTIGGIGDN
jgi:hypothetical protein